MARTGMKRWLPRFLPVAVLLSMVGAYWACSYHGPRLVGESTESQVRMARVIEAARRLRGTFYDPLQGRYEDIGGRLGWIVCSDVPVIAYANAGYSLAKVLRKDFEQHPEYYDTRDGNTPHNPYFHRRARNIYAYCDGNGRLLPSAATPRVGDVAFYKKRSHAFVSHIALVSAVDARGSYHLVEAAPLFTREVPSGSLKERGWIHLGFGRIVQMEDA